MRIVNIDTPSGWRLGAVDGANVIDLNRAAQLSRGRDRLLSDGERAEAERAMPSAIGAWLALDTTEALACAKQAATAGAELIAERGLDWAGARQLAYPLDQAALAPPVAPTASLIAIGLNYLSHAAEAKMEVPKHPLVFTKPRGSMSGPHDPVPLPAASQRIDYEGEIVAVIGRRCRAVDEAQAGEYVAGYTLGNDLSARDWQFRTSEMMLGKAFDGFCPLGPWLVTADEVPDPSVLQLETRVNGEPRQSAPATDMIFAIPTLVSYLSQVMTLEPGDAILTGTPAGIGATRSPRLWLRAGDMVEITADKIGTLTTRIV